MTRARALLIGVVMLSAPMGGCLLSSDTASDQASNWTEDGDSGPGLTATLGDPDTSGADDWPGPFDNDPETYDLDDDGIQEVIAHSNDADVHIYDPQSGTELATLSPHYPPAWHIQRILNSPAAAVMEPGQPPTVVVTNHAGYVSAWQVNPDAGGEDEIAFDKRWENRLTNCNDSPSMDAGPVLADLDGDDTLEILVQTEEQGIYGLDTDGSTMWNHCWGAGNAEPVATDLAGEGSVEAVFASDAGLITVFDAASGNPLWTFDAAEHMDPASVTVAPTVADLDGEEPKEILFTARNATHDVEGQYDRNRMGIFAIHGDRTNGSSELVWLREPAWANPMSYTRLVVDDVDDDGSPDIFGMDWNTIGHRPGNWERLGPAHVFRLDATGDDVWMREIDTWWSNQNIVLGDFDPDPDQELLLNAPVDGNDGVWRLSTEDGRAEGFLSLHPWKMLRAPHPVDVDGDDTVELITPVRPADESLERGALLVHDLAVPLNATLPAPRQVQPIED